MSLQPQTNPSLHPIPATSPSNKPKISHSTPHSSLLFPLSLFLIQTTFNILFHRVFNYLVPAPPSLNPSNKIFFAANTHIIPSQKSFLAQKKTEHEKKTLSYLLYSSLLLHMYIYLYDILYDRKKIQGMVLTEKREREREWYSN